MKTDRILALLLTVFLLAGCGQKTGNAAEKPSAAQTVPKESLLTSYTDEGPEKGISLTCWSYNGNEAAEFLTILLPTPEGFPLSVGDMYEGADTALLTGVVRGDGESGTAELLLVDKDGRSETVLTLMYSRDRVALLELDDGMRDFCCQDEATELWTVVFTDDGPLSFEDAGTLLEGVTEKYSLAPVFRAYGLDPDGLFDLRVPQA